MFKFIKYSFLYLSLSSLFFSCAVVHYKALAQSDSGQLIISGEQINFWAFADAVVLICTPDDPKNYTCSKSYPADNINLWGNMSIMR